MDLSGEDFPRMYHPPAKQQCPIDGPQPHRGYGPVSPGGRWLPAAIGSYLAGVRTSVPLPSLPAIVQRPSRLPSAIDLVDDEADRVAKHIGGGEGVIVARADALGSRADNPVDRAGRGTGQRDLGRAGIGRAVEVGAVDDVGSADRLRRSRRDHAQSKQCRYEKLFHGIPPREARTSRRRANIAGHEADG